MIAGAFYQAVEQNRGGALACDATCANLLKPIIYSKGWNWYLGNGLKAMPALHQMNLAEPQKALFNSYGAKARDWQKKE